MRRDTHALDVGLAGDRNEMEPAERAAGHIVRWIGGESEAPSQWNLVAIIPLVPMR
jgi:hypothetical protein